MCYMACAGGGGVIKGITHCLLPNCGNQVWPFHNYCGRTHADQGMKMGLVGKIMKAPGQ